MQEVKFKSTDIGLIPEDWDFVEIGSQVAALNAGTSVNSDASIITPDSRYVLRTSAVSSGVFIPSERKVVAAKDYDRVSCPVQQGAAIISRMNTPELVGETVYVEDELKNTYLPDRLWQTELKPDSKMNCQWFSYIMNSPEVHETVVQIATGTSGSMHNVGKEAFLNLCIPYPSPKEQNNISEAISDIDKLVDEYNCLIAKKKDIRTGAFNDLFNCRVRLDEREDWIEEPLINLFYSIPTACYTRDELAENGPVKYIHYGDIHTKFGNILVCDKAILPTVSQEQGDKYQKLIDGDLIMADASEDYEGIGKSISIITNGCQVISGLHTILLRKKDADKFDNEFLSYLFASRFVKQQIEDLAEGTKVYSISYNKIAEVIIRYPQDKDEQHLIAQVLSDMDAEIQALEEEKQKYINIKQGMMQQLLTGKIRLI